MKIFTQQFAGTSIPNLYYKQSIGFPINAVLIWNNSPVTFTISNTPGGSPYAIVPPFFSMSVSVPSFGGISISGDGTPPYATSTLQIQVQDEVAGIPFAGQFGPGGWGSGSAPSVLTPVNPGDQILWWQVQQIINLLTGSMPGQVVKLANELILLDPSTNTVKRLVAIPNGTNSYLAVKNNANNANLLLLDDAGHLTILSGIVAGGQFYGASLHVTGAGEIDGALSAASAVINGTLEAGEIVSTAASGAIGLQIPAGAFIDLEDTTAAKWIKMGNGILQIWNAALSLELVTLDDAGNLGVAQGSLSVASRISSDLTGASAKPLLNYVPIVPQTSTVSGSGNAAVTPITLTGVPSSAVSVSVLATLTIAAGGIADIFGIHGGSTDTVESIIVQNVGTVSVAPPNSGIVAVTGSQLAYSISGTSGTWTLSFIVTGYYEYS